MPDLYKRSHWDTSNSPKGQLIGIHKKASHPFRRHSTKRLLVTRTSLQNVGLTQGSKDSSHLKQCTLQPRVIRCREARTYVHLSAVESDTRSFGWLRPSPVAVCESRCSSFGWGDFVFRAALPFGFRAGRACDQYVNFIYILSVVD